MPSPAQTASSPGPSSAGKASRLSPEAEQQLLAFFAIQDTLSKEAAVHLAKEVHGGSTLLIPGIPQREQCVRSLVLHNAHDTVASGEMQRGPGEGVLCAAAHQCAQLHAEAAAEGVRRPCGLPCSACCLRHPLRRPCTAAGPCSCKQRRSSRCSRRSLRRNAVRYPAQMPVVPMTTHGGRGTSSSLASCCMHEADVT